MANHGKVTLVVNALDAGAAAMKLHILLLRIDVFLLA